MPKGMAPVIFAYSTQLMSAGATQFESRTALAIHGLIF